MCKLIQDHEVFAKTYQEKYQIVLPNEIDYYKLLKESFEILKKYGDKFLEEQAHCSYELGEYSYDELKNEQDAIAYLMTSIQI